MQAYALSKGVSPDAILVENQSVTTEENLAKSLSLIYSQNPSAPLPFLLVSNRYHVLRALILARKLGIDCDGRGAKTKLYFSINAFIREWIAYLVMKRKACISLLIAAFVLLAFLFILTNYMIRRGAIFPLY